MCGGLNQIFFSIQIFIIGAGMGAIMSFLLKKHNEIKKEIQRFEAEEGIEDELE